MRVSTKKDSPWSTIAAAIRKRDGKKCRICGNPSRNPMRELPVHHIDQCRENKHPDNLITLCFKCHRNVHAGNLCVFGESEGERIGRGSLEYAVEVIRQASRYRISRNPEGLQDYPA